MRIIFVFLNGSEQKIFNFPPDFIQIIKDNKIINTDQIKVTIFSKNFYTLEIEEFGIKNENNNKKIIINNKKIYKITSCNIELSDELEFPKNNNNNKIKNKAPWYIKLASKIVIKWFLKNKKEECYQVDGKINWLSPNELHELYKNFDKKECTADIQVPYYQIAHWIANECGHNFSRYTLLKEWGYKNQVEDLDEKE